MTLDITVGQIVWYEMEQATVRRVAKNGHEITIQSETGDVLVVSPCQLYPENQDIPVVEETSTVDWKQAYFRVLAQKAYTGDFDEEELFASAWEIESQLTGNLEEDVEKLWDKVGQ